MKVKLKRLEIENEKGKLKKNLENSREMRISLVSVASRRGNVSAFHRLSVLTSYKVSLILLNIQARGRHDDLVPRIQIDPEEGLR